jgi:hypothetical protein
MLVLMLQVCSCPQLEQFGVPRVWQASDYFGLILETDVEHLTKLGSQFMTSKLSIDDGMELVRIECEYSVLSLLSVGEVQNEY